MGSPHFAEGSDRPEATPILGPPREADLSAEEAQARPHPRLSRPHANPRGAARRQATARQGAQAADGLARMAHGRLSRAAEFERVYRQGRSQGNSSLVLYSFPRGEDSR